MKIFISYRRKMGQFDNSNSGYIKHWNKRGYICGNPGDWIAVHMGKEENAYIIPDDIFRKTYDHETKYI